MHLLDNLAWFQLTVLLDAKRLYAFHTVTIIVGVQGSSLRYDHVGLLMTDSVLCCVQVERLVPLVLGPLLAKLTVMTMMRCELLLP